MNRTLRMCLHAVVASVVLNGILVGIDVSTDPTKQPRPIAARIVDTLTAFPAEITQWVIPGHGGMQVAISIVFSILFYAAVAWVALAIWTFWRQSELSP